jgi:hypothetical protein
MRNSEIKAEVGNGNAEVGMRNSEIMAEVGNGNGEVGMRIGDLLKEALSDFGSRNAES